MTSRGRAPGALLLCALVWRAAATTRIPQNIDKNLLDILKHNLRRNNDDYDDRLVGVDVNAALAPRGPAGTRERRVPAPSRGTFHLKDILGRNNNKRNTSTERSAAEDGTSPSPHQLASATRAASPAPQRKRFSSTKGKRPAGKAVRTRGPPPADILDMAPAKGSRINAKREKVGALCNTSSQQWVSVLARSCSLLFVWVCVSQGRLCQRHVLLPEGPKYDAWGTAYLLAHSGRRPFPGTRAPRLLLPACCNCCKKSVLGCE
ncbi:hypothetical protein RR46_01017 [Papilio xuthus]|uniref:Uncharacterized protein n=1 Tax=Papilio xuthus TaxID=66420 RepID=A0A0N1IN12_PAPXU|nr:hypothetical protein RR46_01017 [Papilio xuthus]